MLNFSDLEPNQKISIENTMGQMMNFTVKEVRDDGVVLAGKEDVLLTETGKSHPHPAYDLTFLSDGMGLAGYRIEIDKQPGH